MYIPLEVTLCANPNVLFLIRMIITIIGFTAIFLTLNFYKCRWLRFVFIFLGVTGLSALLLFMLNGSLCAFGIFGSIGLVLVLHCLVLRQIKNDLNVKRCKPYSEISSCCDPCLPCPPCPPSPCKMGEVVKDVIKQKLRPCAPKCCEPVRNCCNIEKKSCCNESKSYDNQVIKSNEIKFTESMENSCYGNKYNKSYYKKSYYNNKCSNKYCKKCSNYSKTDCCDFRQPICGGNAFNELYNI